MLNISGSHQDKSMYFAANESLFQGPQRKHSGGMLVARDAAVCAEIGFLFENGVICYNITYIYPIHIFD